MIKKNNFFKLVNNTVFGKTMKNVRKHSDIKLETTEPRRNYLVSESNYHTKKIFSRRSISHGNEKTQLYMNKPVYLGLSILEISKIVIYEFW